MYLDRWDQQIRVMRPLRIYFVINDDLVRRLLQLQQLAEFSGLAALPLRITSADGSKILTILPALQASPL